MPRIDALLLLALLLCLIWMVVPGTPIAVLIISSLIALLYIILLGLGK